MTRNNEDATAVIIAIGVILGTIWLGSKKNALIAKKRMNSLRLTVSIAGVKYEKAYLSRYFRLCAYNIVYI